MKCKTGLKSLPSLSGNTDQAPKAPVQQMLGTPGRGDIQCLGRMGDVSATLSPHSSTASTVSSGKGAACNHSCALTLGASSNKKHRNPGAKEYRDNTSADAGDCANSVSQTAPHQYKNKGS